MQSTPISVSIRIEASAERVFATWSRVEAWALWDPDTRAAVLAGPLQVGAKGSLTPRKGRTVPMEVVSLVPARQLEFRCPVLGSALHFDHRVEAQPDGSSLATHTVWFSGWMTPFLAATVGRDVRRGLPITLASLKRHVEAAR
jgi:uncharacterized protein YndB with AHSA1/START domain